MIGYDRNGRTMNTRGNVYRQMYIDICMRYSSLPDPRSLSYSEIEFYYDGIRNVLLRDSSNG